MPCALTVLGREKQHPSLAILTAYIAAAVPRAVATSSLDILAARTN